jgi:hypothetical protein
VKERRQNREPLDRLIAAHNALIKYADGVGMKIFTVAEVPEELAQAWLQHLRDFDTAHPGCHFQVVADAPDVPMAKAAELIKIDPPLDFTTLLAWTPKDEP